MVRTQVFIVLIVASCWHLAEVRGDLAKRSIGKELITDDDDDDDRESFTALNTYRESSVLRSGDANQNYAYPVRAITRFMDANQLARVKRFVQEEDLATDPPVLRVNRKGKRKHRRRGKLFHDVENSEGRDAEISTQPRKQSRGRSRNCRKDKQTKAPKGEGHEPETNSDLDSPFPETRRRPRKHFRRKFKEVGVTEVPGEEIIPVRPKDRTGRRRKCRKGTRLPGGRRHEKGMKGDDKGNGRGRGKVRPLPSSSPTPDVLSPPSEVSPRGRSRECSIKNKQCVPRCSELSDELLDMGVQCAEDSDLPPDIKGLFASKDPPN